MTELQTLASLCVERRDELGETCKREKSRLVRAGLARSLGHRSSHVNQRLDKIFLFLFF